MLRFVPARRRGGRGTGFAHTLGMSGPTVSIALRNRFEAIRRAELARLSKKLRGLTEDERQSVDAITAHITQAIVGLAERGLSSDASNPAAEALVRLFGL